MTALVNSSLVVHLLMRVNRNTAQCTMPLIFAVCFHLDARNGKKLVQLLDARTEQTISELLLSNKCAVASGEQAQ